MENTLYDLREIVTRELDEINRKGELDENTLVCAYKLIDILKDIGEIEGQEMGYSQATMYPYSMDDGNSYRGGYSNRYSNDGYSMRQRRDSMGRYSNRPYRGGYSREGDNGDMMEKLERMLRDAPSETERQVIQRIMNQM